MLNLLVIHYLRIKQHRKCPHDNAPFLYKSACCFVKLCSFIRLKVIKDPCKQKSV